MKTKSRVLALVLSLCMLLSLCACGGSASTSQQAAPDSSAASSEAASPAEGEEASEPEGNGDIEMSTEVSGGEIGESVQLSELNIGVSADASNWSPFAYYGSAMNVIRQICEPLGYYDFVNDIYYPVIMKSYEWNEDRTVLTGEIYDYIYDSEGNHLTASDVVFSYEQGCEGTTVNFDRYVASYEATGDYTFQITLTEPEVVGVFAKIVKMVVVTQAAYEASEDGMSACPIGTGPYKLANHTSGYSYTFEKRDDYWQTDDSVRDVRTYTNVDTINYYVISESAQRGIALENGTIDACDSVSSEDLASIRNNPDYQVISERTTGIYSIQPNCGEGHPLNDLNLRLAIFYALNNEAITASAYGETAEPLSTLVPDNVTGYNPEWESMDTYVSTYDPDLAKEYLEKSDYNGETLKLITQSADAYKNAAQIVVSMLEAVGIKVEMEALDSSVFREQLKDENAWDLQINDNQSNGTFIELINGEQSTARSGTDRSANFIADDDYQQMIATCMLTATSTQENLDEFYQYIIDNAYIYPMAVMVGYWVVPSYMSSFATDSGFVMFPGGCTYTE